MQDTNVIDKKFQNSILESGVEILGVIGVEISTSDYIREYVHGKFREVNDAEAEVNN